MSKMVQILRQGWFPASFIRPQTAFMFDCLGFFHELTLQGKVNVYNFYHTLLQVTDNANLSKTVVSVFILSFHFGRFMTHNFQYRYSEFHHIFQMWRNVMALKWAGRGQDHAGVVGTSQGELAVECPACPHPGRNLPDNWQNAGSTLYV